MRFIFAVVFLVFACVPYADLREYHYNRPQTPLHVALAPQQQPHQTIILRETFVPPQAAVQQYAAPAPAASPVNVRQNFGHSGTAQIAQAQGANGYLAPPQYQNSNGGSQVHYHSQAGGNAATVAAAYYPQQQYYTPNVNPLTQQHQQLTIQQQPSYVNLPQQQYGQPQQQQQYVQQQNYAPAQYQQQYTNGGVASSYSAGGHGGSVGGGGASSYYAGGQSAGIGHGGAAVGGAGGSFGANGQSGLGAGQTLPLEGKYVSQSEAGQLHSYQHQQHPIGDTRPFSRAITTCYPNGKCERVTLGPGQADQRHQHTVVATRAKTVPATDKCRLIAEAKKAQQIAYQYGTSSNGGYGSAGSGGTYASGAQAGGANYGAGGANGIGGDNSQGQYADAIVRPHNRRLFPYDEVVLPNDPYN